MLHRLVLPILVVLLPAGPALAWTRCQSQPLPRSTPAEAGFEPGLAAELDALLEDAVASRVTAAAALVLARGGRVVYSGVAGGARPDSLFDLASLTKVVATAPAVMKLVEGKRLGLADPVARHLALLALPDKKAITTEQLLLHTSGLHSSVWAGARSDGRDKILERVRRSALRATPGSAYRYSDLGYLLLGELVATVGGAPFDRFVQEQILEPLGMCQSGFQPPAALRSRLVSPWPMKEEQRLGVVYDPIAARTGGVAGHAGLYASAEDLARFGLMVLGRGKLAGRRILSERTVAAMLEPHDLPGGAPGRRGLGWDISTPFAGSRGPLSARAVGHSGFTGTSLWVDPELDLVLVLLTNRTHLADPGGARAPSVSQLRRRVHTTVVGGLRRPPAQPVLSGLDQLAASRYASLRGRRLGLITNRTAIDREGRWIVDLLLAAGLDLRALFFPEHGLEARLDRHLKDSSLLRAGRKLPVYSLFGSRRRPTPETLQGLDTLVIDLQTVGVRYYTYLSTMGWAMEEAGARGLRFLVLDRPDPLGGSLLQGPVSSLERRTSTNYHPLPVRYGMTLGELAGYFRAERRIPVELEVIRASGWRRGQLFPETGLRWVDPSPNIRSFTQALLYAGVGLLESTNLAVGRGTSHPFQVIGAPWLDGVALAAALQRRSLPGVHAVATSFTPSAGPHRGQLCRGVRLVVTGPRLVQPTSLGIAIAVELRRRHADQWETRNLYRLINHPPTTAAILAGKDLPAIEALWRGELARFREVRKKYLLYR